MKDNKNSFINENTFEEVIDAIADVTEKKSMLTGKDLMRWMTEWENSAVLVL